MTAREMATAWAEKEGVRPTLMYTVQQTADYTGVPYETLLAEIRAGRLRAARKREAKKGYRVRPEDVDEWIEVACA